MRKYILIILIIVISAFAAFRLAPRTHNNDKALNTTSDDVTTGSQDTKDIATVKQVTFEPYKKESFNAALKSDKVVMLFFGANWCSTCALEYSSYSQMARSYNGDKDLIIYYVHIEDDQISEDDKEIATAHNVINRSSKVLFYNGKKVISTASPWTSDKLVVEINAI